MFAMYSDGTSKVLPTGAGFDEVQRIVGGYVAIFYTRCGISEIKGVSPAVMLCVNEDGIQQALAYNARASQLAQSPIVGNVVVCYQEELA